MSAEGAEAREPAELVDLRARIAEAFAAVDNFAGEPPTREQLDWAHIAACVALKIGQDQPSTSIVQASATPSCCSCTATTCTVSCHVCGRVTAPDFGCPAEETGGPS